MASERNYLKNSKRLKTGHKDKQKAAPEQPQACTNWPVGRDHANKQGSQSREAMGQHASQATWRWLHVCLYVQCFYIPSAWFQKEVRKHKARKWRKRSIKIRSREKPIWGRHLSGSHGLHTATRGGFRIKHQDPWRPQGKGKWSNLVLTIQEQEDTLVFWRKPFTQGTGCWRSSQEGFSNKPAGTRGMALIACQ